MRDLSHFERRVFSQNGEDGILEEIFRRIGHKNRFFVEFGIENGNESCCRYLLEAKGWTGLWIEGDQAGAAAARTTFGKYPVTILHSFVTSENCVDLFARNGVPRDMDLLVVDIDGNDYWVWKAILENFQPRVCVVEYNAGYPPGMVHDQPNRPTFKWDGTKRRLGANLDALDSLASKMGYQLVACDSNGVNAFFIRTELLGDQFDVPANAAAYFFSAPKYIPDWFGHPPVNKTQHDFEMQKIDSTAFNKFMLEQVSSLPKKIGCSMPFCLEVRLCNDSDYLLRSETIYYLHKSPLFPVNLSYLWQSADHPENLIEGLRTFLLPSSKPHSSGLYTIKGVAPEMPGTYHLTPTIVQENNAWFCRAVPECFPRIEITVT